MPETSPLFAWLAARQPPRGIVDAEEPLRPVYAHALFADVVVTPFVELRGHSSSMRDDQAADVTVVLTVDGACGQTVTSTSDGKPPQHPLRLSAFNSNRDAGGDVEDGVALFAGGSGNRALALVAEPHGLSGGVDTLFADGRKRRNQRQIRRKAARGRGRTRGGGRRSSGDGVGATSTEQTPLPVFDVEDDVESDSDEGDDADEDAINAPAATAGGVCPESAEQDPSMLPTLGGHFAEGGDVGCVTVPSCRRDAPNVVVEQLDEQEAELSDGVGPIQPSRTRATVGGAADASVSKGASAEAHPVPALRSTSHATVEGPVCAALTLPIAAVDDENEAPTAIGDVDADAKAMRAARGGMASQPADMAPLRYQFSVRDVVSAGAPSVEREANTKVASVAALHQSQLDDLRRLSCALDALSMADTLSVPIASTMSGPQRALPPPRRSRVVADEALLSALRIPSVPLTGATSSTASTRAASRFAAVAALLVGSQATHNSAWLFCAPTTTRGLRWGSDLAFGVNCNAAGLADDVIAIGGVLDVELDAGEAGSTTAATIHLASGNAEQQQAQQQQIGSSTNHLQFPLASTSTTASDEPRTGLVGAAAISAAHAAAEAVSYGVSAASVAEAVCQQVASAARDDLVRAVVAAAISTVCGNTQHDTLSAHARTMYLHGLVRAQQRIAAPRFAHALTAAAAGLLSPCDTSTDEAALMRSFGLLAAGSSAAAAVVAAAAAEAAAAAAVSADAAAAADDDVIVWQPRRSMRQAAIRTMSAAVKRVAVASPEAAALEAALAVAREHAQLPQLQPWISTISIPVLC